MAGKRRYIRKIVPNFQKIYFFGTIPKKAFDNVPSGRVFSFAAKALHQYPATLRALPSKKATLPQRVSREHVLAARRWQRVSDQKIKIRVKNKGQALNMHHLTPIL
jgi:hypothetical protein